MKVACPACSRSLGVGLGALDRANRYYEEISGLETMAGICSRGENCAALRKAEALKAQHAAAIRADFEALEEADA